MGRPVGRKNASTADKVARVQEAWQAATPDQRAWLVRLLETRGGFRVHPGVGARRARGYKVFRLISSDRVLVENVKRLIGDDGPDRRVQPPSCVEPEWVAYLGGDAAKALEALLEKQKNKKTK